MDIFDRMAWGMSTFMVVLLLPNLLMGLAIPYAVLKLRDAKGEPEAQAGFKAALYFFFSMSVMLVLTGLTIMVVDLVMTTDFGLGAPRRQFRDPFPNDAQRTSFGFMISGGLFALIHFICILTLTDRPFSSPVRRMFIGWRFAIHGVVMMFAVTALLVVLFQKDPGFNDGLSQTRRFLIGVLLVWAPSWFVHFVLLRVSSPTTPRRERWTPSDMAEDRPYERPRRSE